jgi:hypothetical protein
MSDDIRLFINTCRECASRKTQIPRQHQVESTFTGYPFEKIAMDIAGPLPQSKSGETYILAIIDYFSKFPMLIPLRQTDSKTVAEALFSKWICLFGVPEVIHTDRGSTFESQLFHEICRLCGISKTKTAPYYPQSDGLVERLFRTTKDMIYSTSKSFKRDWVEVISIVELGLRSSIQKTIQVSPFEVLFGSRMRTPVEWKYANTVEAAHTNLQQNDLRGSSDYILQLRERLFKIHQSIVSNSTLAKDKTKNIKRRNSKPFQIGDVCMAKILPETKRLCDVRYDGPYVISHKIGEWTYESKNVETGKTIQRNYYHLKRVPKEIIGEEIITQKNDSFSNTDRSVHKSDKDHKATYAVWI